MQKIGHYLASCGVCSRRGGERMVMESRVKVNDVIVDDVAMRVSGGDVVSVDDRVVERVSSENIRLFAYNKPPKTIVTQYDGEQCRVTVFELVRGLVGEVWAVGRLDYYSQGLLLLTNSNVLCSTLMHSSLERSYRVLLDRLWTVELIDRVTRDFVVDGVWYLPWKVKQLTGEWCMIILTEGKNREIRRVCEYFGLKVLCLERVSFGRWRLMGDVGDLVEVDGGGSRGE